MENKELILNLRVRKIIGISIMLAIAAIHWFRIGSYLKGDLYIYYYSYASNLLIPFGVYFLLCMNEIQYRLLRKWYVKALIVFGITTLTEIMQAFGVHFLGETFDVIDILMFGAGVLTGVFLDKQILERFMPFWKLNQTN
ncbi:MAG: hypothetical protein KAJ28_03440 [Flavobacteriaceae bacterium]|nr:hypothetical protein [Flavobacteriaceae bacterium]